MSCKWNQKLNSASNSSKKSKCETCDVASYLVKNIDTLSFAPYAYKCSIPRAHLTTSSASKSQSFSRNQAQTSMKPTITSLAPTSDLPPSYEEVMNLKNRNH